MLLYAIVEIIANYINRSLMISNSFYMTWTSSEFKIEFHYDFMRFVKHSKYQNVHVNCKMYIKMQVYVKIRSVSHCK